MKKIINTLLILLAGITAFAQTDSIQNRKPLKIRHAEPLYMDLIRDLGARKGEKEWNVGYGLEGHKKYAASHAFVEYEFSPVNRLGLEVEVPFEFYTGRSGEQAGDVPRNRLEGLKLASQYTFLVSQRHQMSMAAGYMHEFRTHSFYSIDHGRGMLKGSTVSPFFIVAKKWGQRFHSLLYTGPEWEFTPAESRRQTFYQVNASMHYVLPSGNFVGLEVNDEFSSEGHSPVFRPQMKLVLDQRLALGLLTGIPARAREGGLSFMARLVFEP